MAITQKFKDDLIKASEALEKWKSQGNNYFNIFDALGVVHKENYHSAFIAYLLDKNSEHYQSRFAELFLEKLKDAIPNKVFGKLSANNLHNVETEAVTEKIAQNRRVDILLRFDNFVNIIIENKIYAKDQNSQIKDYVANLAKNKDYSPNKTLVIYLHPNEIDPSKVSFGKTSGKWYLDKDGQYCAIRDNGGNIKAYYFQMSYKWIKCWIESCIKWFEKQTQSKIDNGLNKIIFGLNQYIEILEWYITGEWEQNDPVAEFIMQSRANQYNALQIYNDKNAYKNEYAILTNSWDRISESVIKNFYDELVAEFNKGAVKIGKDTWNAYTTDECNVGKWQVIFYKKSQRDWTFKFVVGLGFGLSGFRCSYLSYGHLYFYYSDDETQQYENAVTECEHFFKNRCGFKKDKASYLKYDFENREYSLVVWIMSMKDKAVSEYIKRFVDFIESKPLQETMQEVEKYINKNL